MISRSKDFHRCVAAGLVFCLAIALSVTVPAEAKKKAAAVDPAAAAAAELQKTLDPINKKLLDLTVLVQSRALLSPKQAGELVDIKYKLLDIMNQFPQNELLVRPMYQAGVLFMEREEFNDAYELFHYVALGAATNAYVAKSKSQIQQLEKRFGPNYFYVDAAGTLPSTPATAATTTAAAPAKK
jgi:hypothetical protein